MPKNAAVKSTDDDLKTLVLGTMGQAHKLSKTLFGAQSNLFGVHQLYGYLIGSDDEDELIADIKSTIEDAKEVHETPTPSPEQVFKLFAEVFGGDE